MRIRTELKTFKYIEFDGIRFYQDKRGYWLGHVDNKPKRLHVHVWETYNCKVPKGYHVHHIDHDTNNNEIDNLMLMEKTEHLKYHAKLQNKNLAKENLNKYARPKSIEWHKSLEGSEWHKKHYENMKHRLHKKVEKVCLCCNGLYIGLLNQKYCSIKCKTKVYRMRKNENKKNHSIR